MSKIKLTASVLALAMAAAQPASADWFNLKGSFDEGGFDRYVSPLTNPLFNETPFITTEVRPFYAYHNIPDDFVTNGGSVNVVAAQARLAITERLGFIATSDGYSWVEFDDTLPDADGWNDLTFGFKYAYLNDPAEGEIMTAGLKYTAPIGNIETGGIELNGVGNGYLNPFISAAKLTEKSQLQGSAGMQLALSNENWTFFHASLHYDREVLPNFFPMLETHIMAPVDGGSRLPTAEPFNDLTGADIVDLGADDPETILLIGGGARYKITDNFQVGAGADVNVLADEEDVYGWRFITDVVVNF